MNGIDNSSLETPQGSDGDKGNDPAQDTGETVDISLLNTSLETPQGSGGSNSGVNSDHDSSPEAPEESAPTQSDGYAASQSSLQEAQQGSTPSEGAAETFSPEASARSDQEQDDGDSTDIISPQNSSLEAPQGSDPAQRDGENTEISAHDSNPEASARSNQEKDDGDSTDIISPQNSSLESPQGSDPAQSDGETAGINSPHDSNPETSQGSAPAYGHGKTAGSLPLAPYSPTDTEQRVPASDENQEIQPETEESPADIQPVCQEPCSVLAVANGSDVNDIALTPSVHASMAESQSLTDSKHSYNTDHNTEQAPTIASQSVPETDTSSNTETNNQTSDIATSAYSYPDKPSSVTSRVNTSTAAKVSTSLTNLSTALCPFSMQPLHNNDDYNSPKEIRSESTNNKNSHSELHAASISREDTHQATSDAEKARPASGAPEDTLLVSSRFPGQSLPTGRGIRNLFPQVSVDLTSESSERSNSEVDACEETNTYDNQSEEVVEGDVVLVTGGSGFLGQHIVKLLHLRAPHVGEIRVLDLVPFEKKLDYPTTKRVKSLVGDISNSEIVHKALKGVNSVIHVAGLVSWGTFPDHEGMERVNVKGTLNVLNACLENNVQRLVYCSTVDVAVGSKPIRGGTEEDTPVPDKFLFPGYPETKFHGERIILGAAQLKRRDGERLQTVILRPNVLYGELDKYYVTNALCMAKQSMGILYKIGNGKAMFQQAYAGNTAWAFVCADTAMKANPALTREVFYVPDNTPVQNSFNFMLPYLQVHGLQLSNGYLSYALSHSAVVAAELLAKVLSPLMKLNLPVQSCTIAYINTDLYFRGEKAQRILNYYPIYTPSDARELSMKYYANLDLEERSARGNNPEQR